MKNMKVILLKRDKVRVRHFINHISKKLPNISVFNAVDGKKEIDILLKEYSIKVNYDATLGQLGCTLSHISIWKEMVEKNIPSMIVIEDDAVIVDDFSIKLKSVKDDLPDDYDFLYLFIHPYEKHLSMKYISSKVYKKDYTPVVSKGYFTWGTVGYMLTLSCAKRLIEEFKIIHVTLDQQLSWILPERFKYFCVNKNLIDTKGELVANDNTRLFKSNIWGTESWVK